jgi:stage IV sporulation protein FB
MSTFLAMPRPTAYDVQFRLLGIPVRVHPLFWLIVALLGGLGQGVPMIQVATWVGCVFLSILVHEYGHGLTAAAFGQRSSIALFAFGGLCYSEGGRRTPRAELAVLAMGPGAGFILFGLALAVAHVAFGVTAGEALAMARLGPADLARSGVTKLVEGGEIILFVFYFLFQVNLLWGLLNLLPIWPLDGGRIAAVAFGRGGGARGRRRAHALSVATAAAAAVAALAAGLWFAASFMVYFAYLNYQQATRPA